ncbi:hypothetical protein KY290_035491 [Solanum tuberosum]|uniref:Uncharacterized protein n=3 Tax=Solanum tuberosum TaxID=4113 RepID=A0A3G1NCG7_SOLTU|nr:hypothetical protein [Solanum tuberosum]AUS83367.1 hypothetical protein [Solanum tuberosum]KAH0649011.1 hypothetical protein KY285_034259 [Solanum tuberosum]KAH0679089.1 hypothetical protein KY284_020174 [Solanum tuberosum]KAH0742448.1 hypothetical protein KY290_035491 [Solanum tuberosum]
MNELLEAVAPFVTGLQETLSGRQGANPQVPDALPEAPSQGPHFPLPEIVGQERGEPFFIRRNESMEASMLNRIRKLERQNSLFLLSKAKGEYWSEVKTTLHNCGSQKEYYRLLCFENRDLQIRERKHECFFLFQEILSRNRALRGDAANPTEDFMDFFSGKREVLDKNPEWGPVEKDIKEIEFVEQVKLDLAARGHESPYIKQILGLG